MLHFLFLPSLLFIKYSFYIKYRNRHLWKRLGTAGGQSPDELDAHASFGLSSQVILKLWIWDKEPGAAEAGGKGQLLEDREDRAGQLWAWEKQEAVSGLLHHLQRPKWT